MPFAPRYRELQGSDLLDAAANRQTSRSEFLGANLVQSFLDSPIIGRIIDNNAIAIEDGRKPKALPSFFYDDPEPVELNAEQQKASPDFRQSMGVVPGATEGSMRFRAEQTDQQAWRDFLIERRNAGVVDIALGFGAQIVGGGVDPVNFVPIVGPAMRAAYLARAGGRAAYLLRSAAVGALEGAAGNLLAAPLTANLFSSRGREYGLEDLAADIVFGAAAGGAFGGVGGLLEGRGGNVPIASRESPALAPPPRALTDQRAVIDAPPIGVAGSPTLAGDAAPTLPAPAARVADVPPAVRSAPEWMLREIERKSAPALPRMSEVAQSAERLELATQQVVAGDGVTVGPRATAPAPAQQGLDLFHGSPYQFDEFRSDAYLSGEGSAGTLPATYLTSDPTEAASYSKANTEAVRARGGTPDGPSVYEVRVAATKDELFVTGKPFSGQSPKVQAALRSIFGEGVERIGILSNYIDAAFEKFGSGRAAVDALDKAGIRGLQESGINGDPNQFNVVLFDPARAEIRARTPEGGSRVELGPRPLSDPSPGQPLPDPDAALRQELKQEPPDLLADEFPEIADFELRKEQGRVNAEDLAAFDTASAEAQRLNDIEKAYDVASACVIRGLGL